MATARETDLVTVAAVRTGDRKTVEYLFNERQRIYVLADRTAADDQSARRLKAALAKKRPIKVALNAKRGTIERVSEPTGRELFAGVMVYRRHDPKKLVLCMSGKRSGQTNVKGGLTIYRAALGRVGSRWIAAASRSTTRLQPLYEFVASRVIAAFGGNDNQLFADARCGIWLPGSR